MTTSFDATSAHIFENRAGTKWLNFSKGRIQTDFKFRGQNPTPGAPIHFYLPETPSDSMVTIVIESPGENWQQEINVRALKGVNTARWNMQFPLNDEAATKHNESLGAMLSHIRDRMQNANQEQLFHMARDLRAGHRAPTLFTGKEYPNMDSDQGILLDHLEYIEELLLVAVSARSLNNIRSHLLHYSFLVGDEVYMGFYGDPITDLEASPGTYQVRLQAGNRTAQGLVQVREDPLKAGHP